MKCSSEVLVSYTILTEWCEAFWFSQALYLVVTSEAQVWWVERQGNDAGEIMLTLINWESPNFQKLEWQLPVPFVFLGPTREWTFRGMVLHIRFILS
jgi:hypothetical protein